MAAAPGEPAVPLAEIKAFLRIGHSDEDALLAGLARSASDACEAFTGRVLVSRPIDEMLAPRGGWARLGLAPVRAIETVAAVTSGGVEATLSADSYAIDIDAAGEGWVRLTRPIEATRVRIRYCAGFADAPAGVPEALRHGVIRLVAHLYTHRDRADGGPPPAAVTALWRPWRRLRLS